MTITSTATANVPAWILDEVLSTMALAPLRGKRVLLNKINYKSIAGMGTKTRSIRSYNDLNEAVDDAEGVEFTSAQALGFNANIQSAPETKVTGVEVTADMLELVGGMQRSQVISAMSSGSPQVMPLINMCVQLMLESHYKRAEREALALFSGATDSAVRTSTGDPMSFALLLEAMLKISDNNPAHEDFVAVLSSQGIFDLRAQISSGSGSSLAALFNQQTNVDFFNHYPDVSRSGYKGSFANIPLFEADKSLMATANAAADQVGALFCLGAGAADEGKRGFAEFVERYNPSLEFEYSARANTLVSIGRWCWSVVLHTDPHIVKIVHDID